MLEGPVEIKAENGHPGKHGHGREVHWVADGQASYEGNANEELVVEGGHAVGVGFQQNVEADDEEAGREEDEEDIDTNDFSLDEQEIWKYYLNDTRSPFYDVTIWDNVFLDDPKQNIF